MPEPLRRSRSQHHRPELRVYLPADLIRAVKHAAVDADRSLSAYVEELLRAQLAGPGKQEKRR